MTKRARYFFGIFWLILLSFVFCQSLSAQTIFDSTGKIIVGSAKENKKIDSLIKNHSPRKAAIKSAILPGWGQAYNHKYWKIPIVYAAVGTTGYIFFHNLVTYQDLKLAYRVKYNIRTKKDSIFMLAWGLNVVDATVDAHLKAFDVSPDLSLRFKAGHSSFAGTNGISLILAIK